MKRMPRHWAKMPMKMNRGQWLNIDADEFFQRCKTQFETRGEYGILGYGNMVHAYDQEQDRVVFIRQRSCTYIYTQNLFSPHSHERDPLDVFVAALHKNNVFEIMADEFFIDKDYSIMKSLFNQILPFSIYRQKRHLVRLGYNDHILAAYHHRTPQNQHRFRCMTSGTHYKSNISPIEGIKPYEFSAHMDSALYNNRGKVKDADLVAVMKEQPMLFPGIKYDFNTGECLNRRVEDEKFTKDPEVFKAYQQGTKTLLVQVAMMAKMNLFDELMSGEVAGYGGYNNTSSIYHDERNRLPVVEAIKGNVTDDFLNTLCAYAKKREPLSGPNDLSRILRNLLKGYSIMFHRAFGVYK